MNINSFYLSALVAAMVVGANGFGADCVPQAEMRQIAAHFGQFADLATKDYCYDGSQTANLIQALEFMRKTQYSSSLTPSADELFSGTFANDWWAYFTGRIDDFEIQQKCQQGMGAFVYSFGRTMYVCPMLLTSDFTALDRTSVMMHEARHIDGFPHIMCDRGPRIGIPGACDRQMSDKGSYTVTVETYAQLGAFAKDLHPALRAYARASAVIYADEAFENPAHVDRVGQFLLLTNSKEFYRLGADGGVQLDRWGDAPALGHIVMRAQHMILFPEDKSQEAKYVFAHGEGDIAQGAGVLASQYNAQTPEQRADLVDVHIGSEWNARIFHARVQFACDPTSSATQDLSLSGGQMPLAAVYPEGYSRAASSAHLLTDSGLILEFGCIDRKPFLRPSNVVLDQKYKRVYKSGDEVLGLTADGRLFKIDGTHSQSLQTMVDGQIFDLVPSEEFRFFDSVAN